MTTMNADSLGSTIALIFRAHDEHANKDSKRFRKWDDETPYGIHPTWAAMTILTETSLDAGLREVGAWVLLNHDLYEDTSADLVLPKEPSLRAKVAELVRGMTKAPGDSKDDEFWKTLLGKDEIKLFRLYDKTSNLLDGSWMGPERKKAYTDFVKLLADEVFKKYGDLNIVKMARAVAG